MAFPISPSNGQTTTVNGISYVYSSSNNSWTRTVSTSVTFNGVVANVITANAVSTTNFNTSNAVVSGNVSASNVLSGAIYTNNINFANGSPFVSTTLANTSEITSNVSSGTNAGLSLATTGVIAGNYGSATSIPTIVVDSKGRISSITTNAASSTITLSGTSGTGSVSGGGTLTFASTNGMTATASTSTITISSPQDLRTTGTPTFAGISAAAAVITTAQATNFSSANAVITGGSLNATPIGATTASTGAFTTGSFTGNVTRTSRPLITNFSGNLAPSNPIQGDEWFRGNTGSMYKYVYDNVSSTYNWLNISSALFNAATTATASTLALRDSGANLTAANFIGVASSAKYADLAEIYTSDSAYEAGTVVVFGGEEEITVTNLSHDTRVAGVISTNPAYLMNSDAVGLPVAFTGRVPCKVFGIVNKGDILVTSGMPGVAQRMESALYKPGCIIGKALGENRTNNTATIEVVVGRF